MRGFVCKIGINLASIKSANLVDAILLKRASLVNQKVACFTEGKTHYEYLLANVEYVLARYDAHDSAILLDEERR